MAEAELTAEVARLRDYLLERGHWVLDSPPHCRVSPRAAAVLLGISLEALKKRRQRDRPPKPRYNGRSITYRIVDCLPREYLDLDAAA
jgi:hypothetical protein